MNERFIYSDKDLSGVKFVKNKTAQPSLVKAGRSNAVSEATERANQFEEVEPNKIPVPWETKPRPKIDNEEWANSRLRSLPIAELFATQKQLKFDGLIWHIQNFDKVPDGQHMNPNVVLTDEGALIYDGHHRLAALWLLGAESANCWTLEK